MTAVMTTVMAVDADLSKVRLRRWVPLGTLAGSSVVVIARRWMLWIPTDPEFSWAGTIGILAGFTLFGGMQAGDGARLACIDLDGEPRTPGPLSPTTGTSGSTSSPAQSRSRSANGS